MLTTLRQLLINQFEASLCTLNRCLELCPDDQWNVPVARFPFSQSAFHGLFFTDWYLEKSPDTFQSQPFHEQHAEFFGDYEQLENREPVSTYERDDLLRYAQFCREKAATVVNGESAEDLTAPSQFPGKSFTRAELHVYNIRHVQHHAAQLILKLRLANEVDVPWFRSGWQES